MSTPNDGGPAFPVCLSVPNVPPGHYFSAPEPHPGMSLRDWFAGQAMLMQASWALASAMKGGCVPPEWQLAERSYSVADAMLKAREASK